MDQTFTFSFKRRLGVLFPVLLVEAGLVALLAWRGERGWKTAVVCAVVALLVLRIASYLANGLSRVVLSEGNLSRGKFSVPLARASLEVRATPWRGVLGLNEVILRSPEEQGRRMTVGFDKTLGGFEQLLKGLLLRIPEERIRVSAPGEADVRDERREALLAPVRPTAADKTLSALGRPGLPKPPQR